MRKYIIRLDDASEYMDVEKWSRVECLLKKYDIKPIVGIIPDNKDPELVLKYKKSNSFWDMVKEWNSSEWTIALHGCTHEFCTECGGINPVNLRSEFAGLNLAEQREKIRKGYMILKKHDINPEIFFAPAHTFDENTLKALQEETDIRVISDTIANDVYYKQPFFFIPQQSGRVRNLPFKVTTFCYHPNNMQDIDYENLEVFLKKYKQHFSGYSNSILKKRKYGMLDKIYRILYFFKR